MMTQAWPFLISRNQSVDYKTVVAPDFISQAKIRGLLLKVSDNDFTENEEVIIRWVQGSEAGDFTVVFRVSKANKRDIGENENDVLRDLFGREIYVIQGLVFRETPDKLQGRIRQIHLDITYGELKEKYEEFWNENKISGSYAITIDFTEDVSSPIIQLKELEPFVIRTRRQLPVVQNRTITSKSARRKKVSLSTRIVTILVVLFLLTILWKIFGGEQIILGLWKTPGGNQIIPKQQLEEIKNCSYVTQDEQISFKNQQDGSKPLLELKKKHPEAWIFLNGSLKVKLPEQIKNLVIKSTKNEKDDNKQQTLTLVKNEELKMNYHPLDAAISLLKNQSVTSGDLKARVIESVQSDPFFQCYSIRTLDHLIKPNANLENTKLNNAK